jgi:hypothetical protein
MTTRIEQRAPETAQAPDSKHEPAARQFAELAAAVRAHEAALRGRPVGIRATDVSLYRRLRQICGDRW